MTAPFPAALVEAVQDAVYDAAQRLDPLPDVDEIVARILTAAALSALPAAVQAVARGEAVAVPVEATSEMHDAGFAASAASRHGETMSDNPDFPEINGAIYRAMLAASPYVQEPQR